VYEPQKCKHRRRLIMDLQADINKAAYELYEKGGRIDGHDLDNWLEAERIVMTRAGTQDEAELKPIVRKTKTPGRKKSQAK
jgi:hypothetical protein